MKSEKQKIALLSLAEVIIPSLQTRPMVKEKLWENFCYFLGDMDTDSQKKIQLLLFALKIWSVLRYGRSYPKMNPSQRKRFFLGLLRFPIALIVAGATGLKSLIYVSYYSLDESWENIDYQGPLVQRELQRETK